jgi:hypothetical protein
MAGERWGLWTRFILECDYSNSHTPSLILIAAPIGRDKFFTGPSGIYMGPKS